MKTPHPAQRHRFADQEGVGQRWIDDEQAGLANAH